jgi:alanyl aminopeptidase
MRIKPYLLLLAACAADAPTQRPPLVSTTASASTVPLPPIPATRDDGRLPPLARPLRYAIRLDVDPRMDTFAGTVDIMVDLPEETPHVVLHARGLTVTRAAARIGESTLPLSTTTRTSHGALEPDELVLSAERLLPKGHLTLAITYGGTFGKMLSGLYRASDMGDTYAFTQFEAADARRAFPCFDEPGFKTPFDVTLTVPTGMLALSNSLETARTPNGATTTFSFATTAPIPTYLVAFAVGHFDVVEGQKADPPIRFITTRGRSGSAASALRAATDLLPLLAKYFGIAYPYDKLDLVAVPDFAAGGMENAGIITFRDDAVLLDEHASLRQRRGMVGLMAHELAHQWFGDLVTMTWWDDLWLNEGFATWATYKVVEAYKPAFGTKLDAAASAEGIMDADGLASARAIRQPVASVGQAMEAFDGITYQKGAAILRMIEHAVGEDVFQRGVHAYLTEHAWGNARAGNLLHAIDTAAGKDAASDIATAYLDRPGVPLVVVDALDCDGKAKASFHQERFAPLGVTLPGAPELWKVPFCVASARGAKPECKLLGAEPATLEWTGACPAFANPDAIGYYRVAWPWGVIPTLMKKLDTQESTTRLAALADAWAQARAGKLSGTLLLRMVLPAIDHETERRVIEKLVAILYELSEIVDDPTWPSFSAYVRARLAPHIARLERVPEPKLDEDQRLLRRTLTYAEIDLGEDAALLKKLDAMAKARGADADFAQVAAELSARNGDVMKLRAAVDAAKTPQEHVIALRVAAGVVTPESVRAQLDWAMSPAVKLQDVRGVLWPLASRHRSRPTALAYVREHWDALRQKLPGTLGRGLVGMAGYACSQTALDDARAFYTQKARDIEGADRPLAQALESASLCVALRDKLLPQIKPVLSSSGADVPGRR